MSARPLQPAAPRALAVSLAALWMLVSCGPAEPAPRNVLLLSIDTLRADRLGCYGYDRPTSPFLDGLAQQGVRYENVVAQSPWTLPSHTSLLTGLLPHHHGVTSGDQRLAKSLPSLQKLLAGQGLATAAIINSRFLGERHGLSRGFDHVELLDEKPKAGLAVFERALDWLGDLGEEPYFLFLHTYHVHSDYTPAASYRELLVDPYTGTADGSSAQLQAFRRGEHEFDERDMQHISQLYDAELRELDDLLEDFFGELEALGLLDETLVIVTSDHGEEFREHGDVLHGRSMHRESLSIPMLLVGPGVPAGRRVDDLVMLVDVLPTITGRFGLPAPDACDGIDLARLWEPNDVRRWILAGADHNNAVPGLRSMLRDSRFKLMVDDAAGTHALYDLQSDPGEQYDVSTERAELAQHMLSVLRRLTSEQGTSEQAPPQTAEDLRVLQELGYFHASSPDEPGR